MTEPGSEPRDADSKTQVLSPVKLCFYIQIIVIATVEVRKRNKIKEIIV